MRTIAGLGRGCRAFIVTRADQPTVASLDGQFFEVFNPHIEAVEPRGAGDSFTAGVASALARGLSLEHAIRIGSAAGALNVARRGLGTGNREHIERLATHVQVRPFHPAVAHPAIQTTSPDALAEDIRRP